MKNKVTQQQLAFYKLYKTYKEDPERFIPIHEFVGEIFIPELNKWELMSYTTPHRVFEIFDENPGLIERRSFKGKSGSTYFIYKIAPNPTKEKIKDDSLFSFYMFLKKEVKSFNLPV